jgi:hypothetical protein
MGRMTITCYRPVGPRELTLICESGWRHFPSRFPEQPIFYAVENEEYAKQIARDWNVRDSGQGHVVRFAVDAGFLEGYPVQQVGASIHRERWVPAEDLDAFNDAIVGPIDLIASYSNEN